MIGHQRLVELTHALEMAFDGIRKNELVVNSQLVDICLDSVDALRLLRDEVVQGKTSTVNVAALVTRINEFIRREKEAAQNLLQPKWRFRGCSRPAMVPRLPRKKIRPRSRPARCWIKARYLAQKHRFGCARVPADADSPGFGGNPFNGTQPGADRYGRAGIRFHCPP